VIPKGLHPVYLTLEVNYKLSRSATTALDETAVKAALVEYVNNVDSADDIDVSDIHRFLRETYPEIGYLQPTTIYYQLLAADGRVIYFKTDDAVSIDAAKIIDPRTDEPPNPTDSTADQYRLDEPLSLGVSDNNVRYLTATDFITVTNLEG
jgi:hypothetical protein